MADPLEDSLEIANKFLGEGTSTRTIKLIFCIEDIFSLRFGELAQESISRNIASTKTLSDGSDHLNFHPLMPQRSQVLNAMPESHFGGIAPVKKHGFTAEHT